MALKTLRGEAKVSTRSQSLHTAVGPVRMSGLCHRPGKQNSSQSPVSMSSSAATSSSAASPSCVRRVRTDLKTSENRFLACPRHSSPVGIKHHNHTQTQTQTQIHHQHYQHYVPSFVASSAPPANATYLSAQLPARATRLLNRSRLQDQQQLAGNDSDNSLRSTHSGASSRKRSTAVSRASTASSTSSLQRRQQQQHQHQHQQLTTTASGSRRAPGQGGNAELHSSSDDLMLYDKSFRNAMIQDVLQFKKQLLRLRRILQEDADFDSKRTETLNPFENDNVQLFAACGLDSKQLNDIDLASLTSSTTEDPLQELSDLRRQVVYLQGQVDDRDRTIRLQRDLIEQLEAEKRQASGDAEGNLANKERISMATQTERTRPLAIGAEGLSRSKPEYTSYTTHFPTLHLHCNDSTLAATTIIRHQPPPQQQPPCNGHSSNHNTNNNNNNSSSNNNNNNCRALSQTRRHTIISTTLTNYNQQLAAAAYPRRASIGWDAAEMTTPTGTGTATAIHKPVRITLIGEPLPLQNGSCHKTVQQAQAAAPAQLQQNGVKARFRNGCQASNSSGGSAGVHYQPLYNSNKMTNPTVTIV